MTRSQVHVSTQHHHTFNVQIQPDLRSPLVQINLRNNGITFSGVGMLDSGCTTCIIPISRLPEDARRHMSKSNIRVKGIGGNISILGKLTCDITLGDDTSPAFCNVDTLITTSDIPILIGQNILGHHTLLSYTIDNQKATVELARTFPSGKLKHTIPLLTPVLYSELWARNTFFVLQPYAFLAHNSEYNIHEYTFIYIYIYIIIYIYVYNPSTAPHTPKINAVVGIKEHAPYYENASRKS